MKSNIIKKSILGFLLLLAIYYGILVLAYLIPEQFIMEKWTESVATIAAEDKRWMVIPGNEATKLDTFTDNLIFQKMTNERYMTPFKSSLWIDGYYRYWMGAHALLRPALLFISYSGMRYFNIIFLTLLFNGTVIHLYKSLGYKITGAFIFTFSLIHFWIFPLSIQYSAVFIVLLISINLLLYYNHKGKTAMSYVYLFFLIGSLTNYFDLLTVPLLTFGIPYIVFFSIKNNRTIAPFISNMKELIVLGLGWLGGYSLTWISKWIIGSIILRENMIKSAVNQILFRTAVNGEPVSRLDIINSLTDLMYPSYVLKFLFFILLIWGVLFIFFRKKTENIVSLIPLILVSVLPYLWFVILANHNQHHAYFTYRIQAITVFSLLTFMILSINWSGLEELLKKKIK